MSNTEAITKDPPHASTKKRKQRVKKWVEGGIKPSL